MHSRRIERDGDTLTLDFGHEGVLYKNSFVMYDKQTESKWNHSTGLAMSGSLAGKELRTLSSRMMRWSSWKRQHPETRVLLGEERTGFMGAYRGADDPSAFGLSVGRGPEPTIYPFDRLQKLGVVNDKTALRPIVVVIEPNSVQAFAYSRRVGDRTLSFEPLDETREGDPLMRDRETGSVWNRMTGRALEGPMKGEQLQNVVGVTWRRTRWEQIYEDGTVFDR